jgi:hypothetical protein
MRPSTLSASAARGNLQRRHCAGVEAAEGREHPVAQAEFGLPDGQQDVEQVGVAVMQSMRGSGDGKRTPGASELACGRGSLGLFDAGHPNTATAMATATATRTAWSKTIFISSIWPG